MGLKRVTIALVSITFLLLFAVACLPQVAMDFLFPLSAGFHAIFRTISSRMCGCFSLVGIIFTMQTRLYGASRQIFSLAKMGLWPRILSRSVDSVEIPLLGMGFSAVFGFLLLVGLVLLHPHSEGGGDLAAESSEFVREFLFSLMAVSAEISYLGSIAAFLRLRFKFPQLQRETKYFFGNLGASLCFIFFAFFLILHIMFSSSVPGILGFLGVWMVLNFAYRKLVGTSSAHKVSPAERLAKCAAMTAGQMLHSKLGVQYLLIHCQKEYNAEIVECWKVNLRREEKTRRAAENLDIVCSDFFNFLSPYGTLSSLIYFLLLFYFLAGYRKRTAEAKSVEL